MKVAFWSPIHGQGKVTSNLSILATLSHMEHKLNTMMIDLNFYRKDLERGFFGVQSTIVGEYFQGEYGIDALARNIKLESLSKENVHNCSISLIQDGLHIIPATKSMYIEYYEERLYPVLEPIIDCVSSGYDITFIDLDAGMDSIVSKRILSIADIIVVNLSQNKIIIDDYFNLEPLKEYNEKLVYCLSAYESQSKYSSYNIQKLYKSTNKKIGKIPYNPYYMDAMSESKIIDYIENIIDGQCKKEEVFFLTEAKEMLSSIILKIKLISKEVTHESS